MLTQEEKDGTDYILPKGESCWITVGNKVVYITNDAGISGQKVEVYPLGKEDGKPLDEIEL